MECESSTFEDAGRQCAQNRYQKKISPFADSVEEDILGKERME